MNVLVIAPTPFFADRGTHIRILEEARALEKRGHTIEIVTYHIGKNIQDKIETNISIKRINRLIFWYKKLEAGPDWQKLILDMLLFRKVLFMVAKKTPDVIHAHLHEGVLIGWAVQKLLFWKKVNMVADFHGSLTKEMLSHQYLKWPLIQNTFTAVERWIDHMGDIAISSSWENSKDIETTYKRNKTIHTVLDGVNEENYVGLPTKEESKKALGLPLNKVIVGYTGALIQNKGLEHLLEAIKIVRSKTDSAYFVLAGYPIEQTQQYVKMQHLEKFVCIISPLDYFQLPHVLNACDIAVDPKDSTTRQASGKILQYMAAGLPVVCFDRTNNRQYLNDGAYYSSTVDGAGIAKGILHFVQNATERMATGAENKKRITSYTWDASAKKIEDLYKQLHTT